MSNLTGLNKKLKEEQATLEDLQNDLPKLQELQRERQHKYEAVRHGKDMTAKLSASADLESIDRLVNDLQQDIAEQQSIVSGVQSQIREKENRLSEIEEGKVFEKAKAEYIEARAAFKKQFHTTLNGIQQLLTELEQAREEVERKAVGMPGDLLKRYPADYNVYANIEGIDHAEHLSWVRNTVDLYPLDRSAMSHKFMTSFVAQKLG